jgi:hypothetical protein
VPAPPTPAAIYKNIGAVDDSEFLKDVVRIPVAGPAPLNTLITFTLPVGNIIYKTGSPDPGALARVRAAYVTGLTINGYDPGRPENLGLMQSCTASLQSLWTFDDTAFVAAVDAVAIPDPQGTSPVEIKGWQVDEQGRFNLMVYHGTANDEDAGVLWVGGLLRCWVLCYEAAPPPAETTEQQSTRAQAIRASQELADYQQYVELRDADLWTASQELTDRARKLEAAGWTEDSLDVQQLIVKALRDYTPSADQQVDYLIFFAEQRQNLIARLIDLNRLEDAADLGPETVAGYRDYYGLLTGSDHDVVVRTRLDPDLTELQRQLRFVHLTDEPLQAIQLLVQGFRDSTPPTEDTDRLDFEIKFAEAQQDLIARLIDDTQIPAAQALVDETLDAYRRYASEAKADQAQAVADLTDLARILREAQLIAESQRATQAATSLDPA